MEEFQDALLYLLGLGSGAVMLGERYQCTKWIQTDKRLDSHFATAPADDPRALFPPVN